MEAHLQTSGVSDVFIKDFLKQMNISNHFKGVFFHDDPKLHALIRDRNKAPSFICIVNIGLHFVTLVIKAQSAFYVDTFGMPCPTLLKLILEESARDLYYNKKQIQSLSSTHCGLYSCLFALYFDSEGKHFPYALRFERGKRGTARNDKRCITYLKEIARKRTHEPG